VTDLGLSLGLAVFATWRLFVRRGGPSPLGFFLIYFVYFSFGPALLFYLGGDIYRGTVVDFIPRAMLGFSIALLGWAAADALWIGRTERMTAPGFGRPTATTWSSWTYEAVLVVGSLYGAVQGLRVLSRGAGTNKVVAIAIAGPVHYQYLLCMSISLCWTSVVWRSGGHARRLVVTAWVAFIFYCLATAERDFLLVSYALGALLVVGKRSGRVIAAYIGIAFVALVAGTTIFVVRAGDRLSVASLLNQGSVLFVDTFVRSWIASGDPYPSHSWIAALTRSNASDYGTLSEWFSVVFTGSVDSGAAYGFSLSAEAYMNAGMVGIFVVYLLLGVLQLYLVDKGRESPLYWGVAVAVAYESLYAIRGETYALFSSFAAIALLAMLFRAGQRRISVSGARR